MRSVLNLAAVLAAGLPAACLHEGGDTNLDIVYDPCEALVVDVADDASAAERASVAAAVALWNDRLDGAITLDDGSEPAGAPRLPLGFEDAPGNFYGVYQDESGDILVNRRMSDDAERTITIAHELGHAFGLFHVGASERVSVMNAPNLTIAPSGEDAEAVFALWGRCAPARR